MKRVDITPQALDQLNRINEPMHSRLTKLAERLEAWPNVSGHKRLKGDLSGDYRLRSGDYRMRFRVEPERIVIVQIGHRRDFYED